MQLHCPGLITVVLRKIPVLARGTAEMHRISFAGTLLVPFTEAGNGVLHDPASLSRSFEGHQPALVVLLPLATRFAEVFHRAERTAPYPVWSIGNERVSDYGLSRF